MTPFRRRVSNSVGGALLIYALAGFGCQSHTASEPIGELSREDAIAFLALSDQLPQFREWPPDTILCVAVETSAPSQGGNYDPSNALMARLQKTNQAGTSHVVLKRTSECEPKDSEWIDKASGIRAFVLYVSRAGNSEFVSKNDCGQYLAGWHGGALYGGGNFYAVEEEAGIVSVTRTNCQHFE